MFTTAYAQSVSRKPFRICVEPAAGPARLNVRLMRDCSAPWVMRWPSRPTKNGERADQHDRPFSGEPS
jgi:hypothetical protein